MLSDADPLSSVLLASFAAAFTTQLARQLMKERLPRARRILAAALAAAIASVASCLLLREYFAVTNLALLAVSCVVGWSGARVLGGLGFALESRLGLRLGRLEDREHSSSS